MEIRVGNKIRTEGIKTGCLKAGFYAFFGIIKSCTVDVAYVQYIKINRKGLFVLKIKKTLGRNSENESLLDWFQRVYDPENKCFSEAYKKEVAEEKEKEYSNESVCDKRIPQYCFRQSVYPDFIEKSKKCYEGDLTARIASLFGRRGATAIEIMTVVDNAMKSLLVMGKPIADVAGGSIFQVIEHLASYDFWINWDADTPIRGTLEKTVMPQNPGKKMYDYCSAKRSEFVLSIRMGYVVRDEQCYRVALTRHGVVLVPEAAAAQDKPISLMNSPNKEFLFYTCWEFAESLRSGTIQLSGPDGRVEDAEATWAPFDGDNFFMPDYIYSAMPGEPVIGGESPYTQWPKVPVPMLPMLAMSWFADAMARLGAMRDTDGPFGTDIFLWHMWREYYYFYTIREIEPSEKTVEYIKQFATQEIYKTDDDLIPYIPKTQKEEIIDLSFQNHHIYDTNLAYNVWDGLFLPFLHPDDARTLANVCNAARSRNAYEQSEVYFWPFVGLRPLLHDLHFQKDIMEYAGLTEDEYVNAWMMPPTTFKKLMSTPEAIEAETQIRAFYKKLPDTVPAIFRKNAVPLSKELIDQGYTIPQRREPLEQIIDMQTWHGSGELHLHF